MVGAALAASSACSPLQLDLTVGDASVRADAGEAGTPDAFVADTYVADAIAIADAQTQDATVDAGQADTSPPADAQEGGPQEMPCSRSTDCASNAATPLCDPDAGVCVQCLSANDCTKGNALHCVNGYCIACSTDADCSDAGTQGMVCNRYIPRCASQCVNGTTCAPQGLICSLTDGYCVECTSDGYCSGVATGTYCYLPAGVCGCRSDADCPKSSTCGSPSPTGNRFCE
jgi:hypothetical protein